MENKKKEWRKYFMDSLDGYRNRESGEKEEELGEETENRK